MKLPEGKAHVWYFSVEQFSTGIAPFVEVLSDDEKQKAKSFKFVKDQKISILSRGLLRMISARYLDVDAHKIRFRYSDYGKPAYFDGSSLKFNVSHSGKYIVIAFTSGSEVGVDIEHIKTNFEVLDIARKFFSDGEIESVMAFDPSERVMAFFRCWTRKEAFIKAKGHGLSFPLDAFTVSLDKDDPKMLETKWDADERRKWRLFSFVPAEGYVGALLVAHSIQSVQYFDFDFFKLKNMARE